MTKIVSVEQMRTIEEAADASGLTYEQMMENAGRAIAETILEIWPQIEEMKIVILVGSGNNGGDGLVAGHYLAEAGGLVSAYLTRARTDGDKNFARLEKRAQEIISVEDDPKGKGLKEWVTGADIIIDALLGTGFELPLKGSVKNILQITKAQVTARTRPPVIVAVDCPSGLDCDTGQIADDTLYCDLTITLAAAKPGLFKFPGAEFVGNLVTADIGIPENQKELAGVDLELATQETLRDWLPDRPKNAHKGTFGRALIIAGSINYPGAVALAGLGAYRVGAGLVTLAVPAPIQGMIVPQLPEATWVILPHEMGVIAEGAVTVLQDEFEQSQAVLIGPGFGQESTTTAFLSHLLETGVGRSQARLGFIKPDQPSEAKDMIFPPCVIDADALKLLTEIENWHQMLPSPSILTPHPGEMAVLINRQKDQIQEDRVGVAEEWAKVWGHVVVLKGAFTVVASPDGRTSLIPFATAALARAGTGDVLAGAIVGLRAQGIPPYESAVLGAYLHGRAGELALEMVGSEASVLAGDVAATMVDAIAEMMNFT